MSSIYDAQRVQGALLLSTVALHLFFSSIQSQENFFITPTNCTWTFYIEYVRDFLLVEKSRRYDISRGRIACWTVHAFASVIVECQWSVGILRERHQFPVNILIIVLLIFFFFLFFLFEMILPPQHDRLLSDIKEGCGWTCSLSISDSLHKKWHIFWWWLRLLWVECWIWLNNTKLWPIIYLFFFSYKLPAKKPTETFQW